LKNIDYDILCVSTLTMNYEDGLKMAKIAKQANPECITVFGGIHSTLFPDNVILNKEVDFVCIGEGEHTVLELIQTIEKNVEFDKIQGILYKDGRKVIRNENRPLIQDLDELPFPARELLPMSEYLSTKVGRVGWELPSPSTSIITSRGCPFRCTFCSSHLTFGRKVRFRSPKNVVDEIEYLIDMYSIKGVSFVDDTFTLDSKRTSAICKEILSRGLDIEWMCMGRVDTISKDLLKEMKKAGCVSIGYGIESGSQHVLDEYIKKNITLEAAEKTIKITKEAGITSVAYFMIGTPGETLEDINKTVDFAKRLNPDAVNFSITIPMPGTEMFDIANKIGKIETKSFRDFDFSKYPIFESHDLPKGKVYDLHNKADREFYFRMDYLTSQIFSMRRRPKAAFRILTWLFNRWLSQS
jgi:anaerobic magnesium-protoporphyrin IX monomethyl ester cyclase